MLLVGATLMLRWTPEEAEEYAKRTGINVPGNGAGGKNVTPTTKPEQKAFSQPELPDVQQDLTPKQRTQALGRMKDGEMNKTESRYAEHLELRKHAGEVLWYKFEGVKLRLADKTFYTADFVVMLAGGQLEMHEVKGYWEEDARIKTKTAASMYPFRFLGVKAGKEKNGPDWEYEDFSPWYSK